MCAIKTIEPKTDGKGFVQIPVSKTRMKKDVTPEDEKFLESAKFYKLETQEEHEEESFVFQTEES